jgi:ribonuclease J
VSRGFVYVKESDELMDEAREKVLAVIDRCDQRHISDWAGIKSQIRDGLGKFLYEKTKRRPMIIPIVMEMN